MENIMIIDIKNYNNIKSLEYEISDKKINYLVGISGSGKSSIANSLTDNNFDDHFPFGDDRLIPSVKIDNKDVDYSNYKLFNMNYMNDILITKTEKKDIYNIMIGDSDKLYKIKEDYLNSINILMSYKEKIYELSGMISTLIKNFKIEYNKDGAEYKSTCLIKKLDKNMNKTVNYYINKKKYDSKRIKWFTDGKNTEEFLNRKCPFCNKKLTTKKIETIEKITFIDAKLFEKINSNSGIFDDLNIKEPNWLKKSEVNKFNKVIRKYFNINNELDEIIKYINYAVNTDITITTLKKINLSKDMEELYPELYEVVKQFNNNYENIKKKLIEVKKNSDKLIKDNISIINTYIDRVGISYMFEKQNIEDRSKTGNFIIRYNSKDKKDRTKNLSFGEKNIIGLILFLIANKNIPCLIIDDPASSYDEYRRKVIFDLLYQLKEENTTMLVLSHDHIFAKFAVYHRERARKNKNKSKMDNKYIDYTGKISYMEMYDKPKFTEITKDSFASISEFIKERLDKLPQEINYQTAINMRVYFEINKAYKYHRDVYSYLSAIVHKDDQINILENLKKRNRTEKQLIEVISSIFEKEYSPLTSDYKKNIDIKEYNTFEKLIYARELTTNSNMGKIIKDELNNIVHLNMAYAICLNPYKYNYFSKYVYDYVTKQLKIELV